MHLFVCFMLFSFLSFSVTMAQAKDLPRFSNGDAQILNPSLVKCGGRRSRVSALGQVSAEDGSKWDVPAVVNYKPSLFADDLYNECGGKTYSSSQDLHLNKIKIRSEAGGSDVYTAYIFGDNYFEFYVNGHLLAIDPVPFTPFNSNVIRFTAQKPFTVAAMLVDWEENLGIGTESNRGAPHHPGDGGFVAVIKNSQNETVAITDRTWRAQTFYISPIENRNCLVLDKGLRDSRNCAAPSRYSMHGLSAAHWPLPKGWAGQAFNDENWPQATVFTNDTVGVDNKRSYTNFRNIFDDPQNDAQFIWSPNLVLDNLVLVRKTIK